MKLYLSSYRFGCEPNKIIDVKAKNNKFAVFLNALDVSANVVKREKILDRELSGLHYIGLDEILLDKKAMKVLFMVGIALVPV